jgi:3-methylfumaryl-CoA hydratase
MSAAHASRSLAEQMNEWAPGPVTRRDDLSPAAALALHAVLRSGPALQPRDVVPPLWHWLYFLDWAPPESLGADGHPASGAFLPPLTDRRRVFAGGRLTIKAPLLFGEPAQRTNTLSHTEIKQGRTGEMLLVTVRTEISQRRQVAVVEEQDLIYRSGPRTAVSQPVSASQPPATPTADRSVVRRNQFQADPVTLFQFSALTANCHRIHYDQPYAQDVEGYPALVVHGPLLVLLMAEQVRMHPSGRTPSSMRYRLRQPLFVGERASVTADDGPSHTELAVLGPDDTARATAVAHYAEGGSHDGT